MASINLQMEALAEVKVLDGRYFWIVFSDNRRSIMVFSFAI